MKKILLIAIVLFSLNASTTFATNIPAGYVSGTWTLSGSPYNIQGSIQIPNDSTLIIQPGVVVNFLGHYKLNVQGRLLAIGSITDTIRFIVADTAIGWQGIRFDNTSVTNDSSKIIYCKLQYARTSSTPPNNYGGALFLNQFSKAIISNCIITNCKAFGGAAIYCYNSSPVISHNTIMYNTADLDGGGAIYCENNGSPVITNNIISYNSSKGPGAMGGGITCSYCSAIISDNIITHNSTEMSGGGIYCGESACKITNNTISYNNAGFGGGVYCVSLGYPYPTFIKNRITNNTAYKGGGFVLTGASNIAIYDHIICNNTATSFGGGIYCENSSVPTIQNTTIANNSAANGGALSCDGSSPTFRNCILYGNIASTSGLQVFLNDDGSDPNFYYCDVQGATVAFELNGNFYTGSYSNNINTNPLFVSPSSGNGSGYNGLTADWSLQSTSPCIDKGDPAFNTYPSTDIAGNPRVNVCRVDIGTYEYQTGIPFATLLNINQPIPCNGTTGEITAVVSGGTLPYTYHWSNGLTTDTISGLIAGTYTVTVSTASYGCTLIDSITLVAPVVISVDAGSSQSVICGDSAQLGCIVFPIVTPLLTYQWAPISGLNNSTIPYPKALVTGNIKYFVTVTTSNGCIAIDSINITSSLSITGNDKTVNCGDSTIILNTTTNYTGTDNLTYSWLPITGLDNPNIANPTATIGSNQTYTVTVSMLNGCNATDNVSVTKVPMNAPEICIVGVNSSNKNMIVWNKTVSTAIDSINIYKETNVSGVYAKIGAIAFPDLSVFVDTASRPDVHSDKYKISIHDYCGFESDKSTYHKTMHLSINQGMGTTWNLIWELYEGFAVPTYNIYRGTTPTSLTLIGSIAGGGTTQYTDNTAPGGYLYYQIEVVSSNPCNPSKSISSSLSNIASTQYAGIENNLDGYRNFSIYPNPTNDKIEIESMQNANIEIINFQGQIIESINTTSAKTTIDVSKLLSGVYIIKSKTYKGIETRKFIKQ